MLTFSVSVPGREVTKDGGVRVLDVDNFLTKEDFYLLEQKTWRE